MGTINRMRGVTSVAFLVLPKIGHKANVKESFVKIALLFSSDDSVKFLNIRPLCVLLSTFNLKYFIHYYLHSRFVLPIQRQCSTCHCAQMLVFHIIRIHFSTIHLIPLPFAIKMLLIAPSHI